MGKYTTLYLQEQVQRAINDRHGTLIRPDLMLDFINDALEFLHTQLISMHREGVVDLYWPWKLLKIENFSFKNTITLPENYLTWIEIRVHETEWLIEIVPYKKIEDTLTADSNPVTSLTGPYRDGVGSAPYASGAIYASNVSSPLPDSGNAGLDEFQLRGHFSGSANTNYAVELDGAGTYRWSNDGGSSWEVPATIAITGDWQTLENDIEIKFDNTTGYTIGDRWDFTAYVNREVHILKLNYTPTADVQLTYAKILDLITEIGETIYLPFERFYLAERLFVELKSRAYNEEKIDIDVFVNRPVITKIRDIGVKLNVAERIKFEPDKTYEDYV